MKKFLFIILLFIGFVSMAQRPGEVVFIISGVSDTATYHRNVMPAWAFKRYANQNAISAVLWDEGYNTQWYSNMVRITNVNDVYNGVFGYITLSDAIQWDLVDQEDYIGENHPPDPTDFTKKFINGKYEVQDLPVTPGSTTFSGLAVTTQYVVTHGLDFTPSKVQLQAKSAAAAELCYVDNITSTTFRITFISNPTVGSNNISFDWFAYR